MKFPTNFQNAEVRDLHGVFEGPNLLDSGYAEFSRELLPDSWFQARLKEDLEWYRELDQNLERLTRFLNERHIGPLLGRYFEALISFWIQERLKPRTFHEGVAVSDSVPGTQGRQTIGEFDFVFTPEGAAAQHWEASVKFYLYCGEGEAQASDLKYFVGTFLRDRLDKKVDKIFNQQLRLRDTAEGRKSLNELGIVQLETRAFVKGTLFYPFSKDWRHHPHPKSVSVKHNRGWWAEADQIHRFCREKGSNWVLLPKHRWLSQACVNPLPPQTLVLSFEEMTAFTESHFKEQRSPLMWAEVLADREVSRGIVVYPGWLKNAHGNLKAAP